MIIPWGQFSRPTSQSSSLSLSDQEEKLLKCGDLVRFGLLSSIFRLETSRLVICTSGLATSDMASIKKTIGKLGGCAELTGSFSPRVTHLVIKDGKLTIKVANALAKCVPLVNLNFLDGKSLLRNNIKLYLPYKIVSLLNV